MERIEELSRRILIVYLLRHRKFKPINDEHSYVIYEGFTKLSFSRKKTEKNFTN